MSVPVENILLEAIGQEGDRYVWGGKGDPLDPDPDGFDCSGLVTWACERAGVAMANGAFWQYKTCENAGTLIDVDTALATRGALLFVKSKDRPVAFNDVPHVAISLGDGTTVEARGTKWGVGTWAGAGRFQGGGLIPDVDYATVAPSFRTLELRHPYMHGLDVEWAQNFLNRRSYIPLLRVDQEYGPKTAARVEEFQRDICAFFNDQDATGGIDGIAGGKTIGVMQYLESLGQ